MNPSADQLTRKIVPFGPSAGDKQSDELDRSGEAIISLLQQAADAARANEDRAANILHKLSAELQAAEDHAAQLEAQVQACQDRAFRAEKWLLRVYREIEEQFFNGNRSTGGRRSQQ